MGGIYPSVAAFACESMGCCFLAGSRFTKGGTGYKALKTKKPGGTRTQVKYEEKGVTLLMDLGTKVPYIHITVN